MIFIKTLITSSLIFLLLFIIGFLLSLFVPALGKSLHQREEIKRAHDLNNNVFRGE